MSNTARSSSPPRGRWAAFAVVLVAVFMDLVDGTMVSVALPRVQADLQATDAEVQWIVAAYLLAFALGMIPGGRLGDVHGRRRVFLVGTALFVLSSVVCGAAASGGVLVAGRVAQGLGAALMVPQAMALIVQVFGPEERPRAFVVYGAVLSLANVGGPLLGALFLHVDPLGLGWRGLFYVNVPIGLLALLGALRWMPESRSSEVRRVDLLGLALLVAATSAVMVPLVQGREAGWPWWTVALAVLAVPLFAAFHRSQRRRGLGEDALVPPALLRRRSFTVGLVVMFAVYSVLSSLFVVLHYALQLGLGWTPMGAALVVVGFPLGVLATTSIAQRYVQVAGRRLVQVGLSVICLATAGLALALGDVARSGGAWTIALPIAVMGLGMGLCVSILTSIALVEVPARHAGAGSGVANAVLQCGGAFGVAVVGTLYFGLLTAGSATASDHLGAAAAALGYHLVVLVVSLALTPFLPRSAVASAEGAEEVPPVTERSATGDRPTR
ncbi:MFS transporter [Actinoalloteichus caeruleus]|uniref:MFS transporter n=1 Tax=Actinoalloteichus cyanogriseus TaxID=2893586 RepID=UPI003AADF27E